MRTFVLAVLLAVLGPPALASDPVALDAWGRYQPVVDIFYKATPKGWDWVPKARVYFLVERSASDDVALVQFLADGAPVGPVVRCPLGKPMQAGDAEVVSAECMPDFAHALHAPATIEARVGYRETGSGKDHEGLARYTFEVAGHKDANGRAELHVERDARLGEAWLHYRQDGHEVELFMWFKEGDRPETKAMNGTLRCAVNGKPLTFSEQTNDRFSTTWRDYSKDQAGVATGYSYNVFFTTGGGRQFLRDHPGEYRCSYTRAGELERELVFTIGKDGQPQKPACQTGARPLVVTPPSTTMVKQLWKAPQDVAFDRRAFAAGALLGKPGVATACGF